MTPAARIKATIELLGHIAISPVPMDTTVGDYMRSRRYIGGRDRANIAERVYDIMRARARLGWWLAKTGARDSYRNRVIFWLALAELKSGAFDIADLFAGGKYGAEKLTAEELAQAALLKDRPLDDPEMPLAVRVECPPDYEERLRACFGADFESEMKAMIAGATLDLRVNTAKVSRDEVQAALRKDGVQTDPTPYAASGLRARDKAFLAKTKAFIKGWIDIQDEGSQLTAEICEARPGMQVIDYCAGAGGKTLALADAMRNKGRIVAMDIDGRRLEKARARRGERHRRGAPAHRRTQPEMAQAPERDDRPRPGRRALQRQRHLAAQSGHALARLRPVAGRAARGAGRDPRQDRPNPQARRAAGLCHVLAAAGGKRAAGRGLPAAPSRVRAGHPERAGRVGRSRARARHDGGPSLHAADPFPSQHRRLFRRRAAKKRRLTRLPAGRNMPESKTGRR
jgi:hypothetical protein